VAKAKKPSSTLKSAIKDKTLAPSKSTKNTRLAKVSAPSESAESLSYKEELYQFLKSKDHYPPIAAKLKHSGRVQVRIKIDKDGKFIDVDLITPSNYKTLNQGTLSFLKKLAYFKPLPKLQNSQTFEVPIVYEL
jgi:TonB family protein